MSKSGITKDLTQGGTPQRAASFFLDERTNALGNEDTFLTLMSMRSFFPASADESDENKKARQALNAVAKEEARYMVQASQALHGKVKIEDPSTDEGKKKQAFLNNQATLRRKFGRDMNAVADLAKVLKNKIEDKETDDILLGVARGLERDDGGSKLVSGLTGGLTGGISTLIV